MLTEVEQAGIPLAYIFSESADERTALASTLKPIAEKHKGKINIATIDAKAFGQHAQNLNLEVGKWPAFAIQDPVKNQKFPMEGAGGDLTEKAVGKFVDDFVAGKVEASVKSEPIPEKQEGSVTVVVAKNYKEVVMDDKKDVLVEFYAPWCGHCKAYGFPSFHPHYHLLSYIRVPKYILFRVLKQHRQLTHHFPIPQPRAQIRRTSLHVHPAFFWGYNRQSRRNRQRRPGRDPRIPDHKTLPCWQER